MSDQHYCENVKGIVIYPKAECTCEPVYTQADLDAAVKEALVPYICEREIWNEAARLQIERVEQAEPRVDSTKNVLLSVADGPEHIELYTSEDEAVVDWAKDFPALYISVSCGMNSCAKFGPFSLSSNLIEQLAKRLR